MKNALRHLPRYWKTVMAALTAFATIGTVFVDSYVLASGDGTVETSEWLVIVTTVIGAIAVYAKKNVTPPGEVRDPDVSEAEGPALH